MPQTAQRLPGLSTPQVPESVSLEIFTIRVPLDDPDLREVLWSEVDEQQLPSELRRRLSANGFRAGVLGTQPPAKLERLLKLTDKPVQVSNTASETQVDDFEHEPPVRRKVLQIRGGRKMQIIVLGESPRLPELAVLLRNDDDTIQGRTYRKVMGELTTTAWPEGDGRVRLEVQPELEHGDPQRRFEPGEGMLRVEISAEREKFETLRTETHLAPGQFLLISCLTDRPGTLGHHFFTEKRGERTVQKLVLVRLAHTQYDDLFSPDAPPKAD
jgi:hypothetical protein